MVVLAVLEVIVVLVAGGVSSVLVLNWLGEEGGVLVVLALNLLGGRGWRWC